jgi:shikimate dehydrogenase
VRRPEAATDLERTAAAVGVELVVRPWSEAGGSLAVDVVVSTVPRGAADELAAAVPDSPGTLLDVVYHPWPTVLATAWHERGGPIASGLDLLLHQAVHQVRLMTGRQPSTEVLRAALAEAAAAR